MASGPGTGAITLIHQPFVALDDIGHSGTVIGRIGDQGQTVAVEFHPFQI